MTPTWFTYLFKKESPQTNLWVNAPTLRNDYNPRLALKNTRNIKQNKKGR
jgi:hypothetical protein